MQVEAVKTIQLRTQLRTHFLPSHSEYKLNI